MLTVPAVSRRSFTLSAFGGGALLARFQAAESHIALLSDLHISQDPANSSRGFRPYDNLAKAAAQVAAAGTQAAVLCGDLARNEGLPGDYANLKKLLEPISSKMPVALEQRVVLTEARGLGIASAFVDAQQLIHGAELSSPR